MSQYVWECLQRRGIVIPEEVQKAVEREADEIEFFLSGLGQVTSPDDAEDNGIADLPREQVVGELTEVTAKILWFDWVADVHGQQAGGELYRAQIRQAQLIEFLAADAEQAIEKGRRTFAAGFQSAKQRDAFLGGNPYEYEILKQEAKLDYLKMLAGDGGNPSGPCTPPPVQMAQSLGRLTMVSPIERTLDEH